MVCSGINPNTCCRRREGGMGSVALRGIPIGWLVELRAYSGGSCNNLDQVVGNGGGASFVCSRGGSFTGAGYNFYGKKRDEAAAAAAAVDQSECQRPDTLVLPDGSRHDVTGLNEDEYEAL
jgi:hypothetical protein